MTWTKKRKWQRQIHWQRQWQRQIHLESTFKERSLRLVTFKTFDKSDDHWPDQTNISGRSSLSPKCLDPKLSGVISVHIKSQFISNYQIQDCIDGSAWELTVKFQMSKSLNKKWGKVSLWGKWERAWLMSVVWIFSFQCLACIYPTYVKCMLIGCINEHVNISFCNRTF